MVDPVELDARGIVSVAAGLRRFRLDRFAPTPGVARFVDRYWLATWDLRGEEPHVQQVFAHPVVNIVFATGGATVGGVTTQLTTRVLEGQGWAFGVMFRPGGFHPFLGRPMSSITDKELSLGEVFGSGAATFESAVAHATDGAEAAAVADVFLAELVPARSHPSETTTAIAERVAADPAVVRVDALAGWHGLSVRQLQRRFAEHVGVGPKAVIRRYRLYEAAERARRQPVLDWAALAVELGYSDQAHLTRDFSATFGVPPDRYARACRNVSPLSAASR